MTDHEKITDALRALVAEWRDLADGCDEVALQTPGLRNRASAAAHNTRACADALDAILARCGDE